jgi:hypothetical protein
MVETNTDGRTVMRDGYFRGKAVPLAATQTLDKMDRKILPVVLIYGGLFAALALNWFLPVGLLAGTNFPMRFLTVGGTSALPVFFAGMIFARSFKTTTNPTFALGSNVLGSVAGGAIEYLSLITGLRFLILIMAVLYGASAVWARR